MIYMYTQMSVIILTSVFASMIDDDDIDDSSQQSLKIDHTVEVHLYKKS